MDLKLILQEAWNKWGFETVEAIKKKIKETQPYPPIYSSTMLNSVTSTPDQLENIKFSIVDYAQYIDEGTGTFGPRKAAIPKEKIPGMAYYLTPWSTSKGLNPWAVATSIVNKGGLQPRRFYKSVIESRINDGSFGVLYNAAVKAYMDDMIKKKSGQ